MYHDLQSIETMATYQQSQGFEAEPKKLSFHELFQSLVDFRSQTVNQNVARLLRALEESKKAQYPDVSKAFQSSFDKELNRMVPMVDAPILFDKQNIMAKTGAVEVEKVATTGNGIEPLNIMVDENDAVTAARQHLAYIETLTGIDKIDGQPQPLQTGIDTYTDDNFTLAA